MINHHPAPELLADYSSGGMRLSHALCIASHLEYCAACRQDVKKLARLGAHIFSPSAEEIVQREASQEDEDLKVRVLASLVDDCTGHSPAHSPAHSPGTTMFTGAAENKHHRNSEMVKADSAIPRSVQQFVKNGLDEIEWRSITPSIKVATLFRDQDGAQIALSCVQAGGQLPYHKHAGDELTVVLKGSFSDDSGIFSKGDFIHRDENHQHKPVVTKDAECICLMVLDAPIQFTGFFTRWLNPLVRRHHAKSPCIGTGAQ